MYRPCDLDIWPMKVINKIPKYWPDTRTHRQTNRVKTYLATPSGGEVIRYMIATKYYSNILVYRFVRLNSSGITYSRCRLRALLSKAKPNKQIKRKRVEAKFTIWLLKFTVRKMTFIADTPTLRVMMNGFDSMVRPTIDVQRTEN